MVYKANRGWAYRHDCTENHRRVEGPFKDEAEASEALREHEEKCNG